MGVVQGGAPFYTPPICRSARNAAFRRRFRGKRGLRKPQRPPTRGRGSREAADKPLQEAGAFELLFFFAQTRRLLISSPPLPPRQTPSFSRAAQSAHLRGAPHTALPYAAGGGEAAAPCRPAPKRAGRRVARVGIVQRGCAVLYVADLQECEKCGVSAEVSGKTGIEKAAAPADEGARKPRSG